MAKIIFTSQVEDSEKWAEGFVTHGDLFKEMTITGIEYTATKENEIAIYFEVDDPDKYFEILDSPATAEAMAFDGVKRDTFKIFVLDKEFDL